MGLKEQIKNAGSEAEINELLKEGKSFDMASDRTKNAWRTVASRKLQTLNTPPTKPVPTKK